MKNHPVLIVLSGGQDSATCLFWAIREYGREQVRAVGFDYGQRHAMELELAARLCGEENIPYDVLDLSLLGQLAPNALTRTARTVDGPAYEGEHPNTFVNGRNLLFLSFAAVYAKQRGIRDIVTGVSQTDFSGYPDCRDAFIKSLNVTLDLAMDYEFRLITPLMWKNKAETWAMAEELGCLETIRTKTLTCYNGIVGDGCGECPACALRRAGYEQYSGRRGKSQ